MRRLLIILVAASLASCAGHDGRPRPATKGDERTAQIEACAVQMSKAATQRGMALFAFLANRCASAVAYEQVLRKLGSVPEPLRAITVVRMSCLPLAVSAKSSVCRDLGSAAVTNTTELSGGVQVGCATLVTGVLQWIKTLPGDAQTTFMDAADAAVAARDATGPGAKVIAAAQDVRGRDPSQGKVWALAIDRFMAACGSGGYRLP